MNRRQGPDNRRWLVLLLALLLCAALGQLHRRSGRADPVTGAVRDAALVPAQTLTTRLDRWWQQHVASVFRGPALARQNAALKTQVQTLAEQNRQLSDARAENERLRHLLLFQKKSPRRLLAAEVVTLKPSPLADTLTLNRGVRGGARPHGIVLGPDGGLVGQIIEASSRSSIVLLLTDSTSSVGAQALGRGAAGKIGLCQGDRSGRLRLTYLGADADVRPGDQVVTSGLGGVFPKGIPLGTVVSVTTDRTRSIKTARLKPAADFDRLQEAFLLLP